MMYRKVKDYDGQIQIYEVLDENGKIVASCNANNVDLLDWIAAGNTPLEPVETVMSIEEQSAAVRHKLQSEINARAVQCGFSDGNSLMLYAGKDGPFRQLGDKFFAWESQVWYEAGIYKEEVLAGKKPMLSPEEAVAMMPEYPQ